jgi:hypothetical protein
MSKPKRCPRCESTNILCHLGWCECLDCDYEWSYSQALHRLLGRVFKKLGK